MFASTFDTASSLLIFCISALLFFACTEVGFRIGRHVSARREDAAVASSGIVTGSILGLVSFLLAFSFGIASSNFSERRGAILDEANAIGTAFLRADLLDDVEARQELRAVLTEYTRVRASVARDELTVQRYFAIIRASERLHGEMWEVAARAARETPSPTTALVVSSINDVIDLHSVRVAVGVRHTIPDAIWLALYVISAIALAATGYRFGASHRTRSELLPGMVVAFTCIITLIADLDNPRHGFLMNDHAPMQDLLRSIRAAGS